MKTSTDTQQLRLRSSPSFRIFCHYCGREIRIGELYWVGFGRSSGKKCRHYHLHCFVKLYPTKLSKLIQLIVEKHGLDKAMELYSRCLTFMAQRWTLPLSKWSIIEAAHTIVCEYWKIVEKKRLHKQQS